MFSLLFFYRVSELISSFYPPKSNFVALPVPPHTPLCCRSFLFERFLQYHQALWHRTKSFAAHTRWAGCARAFVGVKVWDGLSGLGVQWSLLGFYDVISTLCCAACVLKASKLPPWTASSTQLFAKNSHPAHYQSTFATREIQSLSSAKGEATSATFSLSDYDGSWHKTDLVRGSLS